MNIAVLSDTRLPTNAAYPGHGLGQQALLAATELAARGHDVTLYAGPGSAFDAGRLIIDSDERNFRPTSYDVVLDSSHTHRWQHMADAPVVNWSHDRESNPGKCAIYPSKYHRDWHVKNSGAPSTGRIIYNGVNIPDIPVKRAKRPYVAFMAHLYKAKAPLMAYNAARMAGQRVVFAGDSITGHLYPDMEYIGVVAGINKHEFLAGADALIYSGGMEPGTLAVLEAQALGTPVIVSAYGGVSENMAPGKTGVTVRDTLDLVAAFEQVRSIDRAACREWVQTHRSVTRMIDGIEQALKDAVAGEVW